MELFVNIIYRCSNYPVIFCSAEKLLVIDFFSRKCESLKGKIQNKQTKNYEHVWQESMWSKNINNMHSPIYSKNIVRYMIFQKNSLIVIGFSKMFLTNKSPCLNILVSKKYSENACTKNKASVLTHIFSLKINWKHYSKTFQQCLITTLNTW